MKIRINCILLLIVFASMLFGCKQEKKKNVSPDKKSQLLSLKQERNELDKKIKKLEAELNLTASSSNQREYLVVTKTLTPQYFEHSINIQGMVESDENILVTAQTSGIVNSIHVSEGQKVEKGQTLAQLDNSIIEASIDEIQTSLDLAETKYKRQAILWNQKIGTEIQYITAKHEKDALVKKLTTLKKQLAQTRIIAPVNGTIDNIIIKIGEMASPGAATFRIVNDSKLKVRTNIPERYISMIKKNDKVIISFPDINLNTKSSISFVSRSIDLKSRTFIADAMLKPNALIKPNMVAVMKIIDYTNKEAIVVPLNIIQHLNERSYVLIADKNNIVDIRYVETGAINGNKVEVKNGLEANDIIIVQGFEGLTKGDIIKTTNL